MLKSMFKVLLALAVFFSAVGKLYAQDTTGIEGFVNDDRHQFAQLWINPDGNVTIKVSNGRQWNPMWIVLHAHYYAGDQLLRTVDYHVYCPSPNPFGGGKENWFRYAGPNVPATRVVLTSNKTKPWTVPEAGWTPTISWAISPDQAFSSQQAQQVPRIPHRDSSKFF